MDLILKAGLIGACLVMLALGNALWFAIVHFERFAGDPQKRCLSNILSSYACLGCAVSLTMTILITLSPLLFECSTPQSIGYGLVFFRRWSSSAVLSFLAEILLYKMLQVYSYYFVAGLNDTFWGIFLLLLNLVLTLIFNGAGFILETPLIPKLDLDCDQDSGTYSASKNKFLIIMTLTAFVICATMALLTLAKKLHEINKDKHAVSQIPQSRLDNVENQSPISFNNQRWNKALASTGQYVFILLIYALGSVIQQHLVSKQAAIEHPWLAFPRHLTLPFINGIIVPSLFLLSNKNARKYVKQLYNFKV